MIYPFIVTESSPIPLSSPTPHPITSATFTHPIIAAEALESYYQSNTFILNLPDDANNANDITNESDDSEQPWGPHASLAKHHIHTLVVQATESRIPLPKLLIPFTLTQAHQTLASQRWRVLLALPHLSALTIRLQKTQPNHFVWQDMNPILRYLQARHPHFTLRIEISFDGMLRKEWEDPRWLENGGEEKPYDPMGYINVSELFAAPTEADRAYCAEYLPDHGDPKYIAEYRVMLPSVGRPIILGLLSCSAEERRVFGVHYVIRDPPLLRMQMQEHFEWVKELDAGVEERNAGR
jgi:hypothetical protein